MCAGVPTKTLSKPAANGSVRALSLFPSLPSFLPRKKASRPQTAWKKSRLRFKGRPRAQGKKSKANVGVALLHCFPYPTLTWYRAG